MIKTVWNFFNFSFLKRIDKNLLINRPWLWNLKLHYIAFYSLVFSFLIAIIVLSSSISYTGFGLIYPILIISLLVIEGIIFLYWIYRQLFLFSIEKGYGDVKKIGGSKEVFLWIVTTFFILLPSITLASSFQYKFNHFNVDPSNTKFEMLLPRYFLLDDCLSFDEGKKELKRDYCFGQEKKLELLKKEFNLKTLKSEEIISVSYHLFFINLIFNQKKDDINVDLYHIKDFFYSLKKISFILIMVSILFIILYYSFIYKYNTIYNFLGSLGLSVVLIFIYTILGFFVDSSPRSREILVIYMVLIWVGIQIFSIILIIINMEKYSRLNIVQINLFLPFLFIFSGFCVEYILESYDMYHIFEVDGDLLILFSSTVGLWYIFIFILFAGFVKRKLLKLYSLPRD